jgi:hypothetical protein
MQKETVPSSSKRGAKRDDLKSQNRCTMQAAKTGLSHQFKYD